MRRQASIRLSGRLRCLRVLLTMDLIRSPQRSLTNGKLLSIDRSHADNICNVCNVYSVCIAHITHNVACYLPHAAVFVYMCTSTRHIILSYTPAPWRVVASSCYNLFTSCTSAYPHVLMYHAVPSCAMSFGYSLQNVWILHTSCILYPTQWYRSIEKTSSFEYINYWTGTNPRYRATCFACKDELSPSRMTNLECGHWLCSRCLKQRFKNSLTDSRQMPPTCCSNPIPVKHVDKHFDSVFKRDWNERHYEVSLGNRMYCFKCGSTVSADSRFRDGILGEIAQCDRCRTKLCVRCHHKAHKLSACPSDPKIERSLDKYRKEGRQHCHKCRAQVDYHDGRNRLNCEQCNAESCMICGGRWGFCNCPVFDVD